MNVVAAVIRRGDKFLIAHRPSHKPHGDLWEFPGGKVNEGETELQALTRELNEELGLVVQVFKGVLGAVHEGELSISFLEVEVSGEVQLLEHQEVRWCTQEEVADLPLCPVDHRFITEAFSEISQPFSK